MCFSDSFNIHHSAFRIHHSAFIIPHSAFIIPHSQSEPKVNKRTEAGGIERGDAEHKSKGGKNPHPDMLTVSEVGVIGLFLPALPEFRQCDEREDGCNHHNGIDMGIALKGESAEVEGEHARDESPGQADVLDAEEDPDDAHRNEGKDDRRESSYPFHHLAEEEFVGTDEETVQRAPNNEIPAGTVPQSRKKEANPQVEVHTAFAFAVAAKWDVKVVHDESAEGFVPTSPKLGDAARSVRIVEVFGELEAHDATQADGHIAIARKIEVDLEGVGQCDKPSRTRVQSGNTGGDFRKRTSAEVGGTKNLVDTQTDDIGNKDLFAQTYDEAIEPLQAVGPSRLTMADLFGHVAITHDGASNQLREHGDIQHVVAQLAQRLVDASVGVQSVGDALEREERDTNGQHDAFPR